MISGDRDRVPAAKVARYPGESVAGTASRTRGQAPSGRRGAAQPGPRLEDRDRMPDSRPAPLLGRPLGRTGPALPPESRTAASPARSAIAAGSRGRFEPRSAKAPARREPRRAAMPLTARARWAKITPGPRGGRGRWWRGDGPWQQVPGLRPRAAGAGSRSPRDRPLRRTAGIGARAWGCVGVRA